jgi:hypothetical protein
VGAVLDENGLSEFDELASLIDGHWTMTIWGCAFEDFLTRNISGAGFMGDEYLKRRGWKESVSDRAYIAGLKISVMSLYEASEIQPGQSFLARDLIRGGDPVLIQEGTATKSINNWDRLAMRIVEVRGKYIIAGGLLSFDQDESELLLETIDTFSDQDSDDIQTFAPLFSLFFLEDMIGRIIDPDIPTMVNREGDQIEFIRVVFRLTKSIAKEDVHDVLNSSTEFEAASPKYWDWVENMKAESISDFSNSAGDLSLVTTSSSGSIVLGTVELKDKTIELAVNSEMRAERGKEMLADLLVGLVGFPLMERQTLERALDDHDRGNSNIVQPDIDPAEHRKLIHDAMDQHYRAQLNQPIPALGNISPRKASKSVKGKRKLENWLKRLENHNARSDTDDPMASYNTIWLWEELGISHLRK